MLSPIVIVGARRSGTTLLREILSQHPGLLVHPDEPQFILEIHERFGTVISNVDAAARYICTHRYASRTLDEAAFSTQCASTRALPWYELLRCYFRVWGGDKLNSRRVVVKEPALAFHLDKVRVVFPDAHVVHIVRDPRANVASQLARWTDAGVWECATWWREAVRAAREWQATEQGGYTELRYEDLVNAPEDTLVRLCETLTIPYYSQMLEVKFTTRLFTPGAPPRDVTITGIDRSRARVWRENLTPLEIRLVESRCHAEMMRWDYSLMSPTVPRFHYWLTYVMARVRYLMLSAGRRAKHAVRRLGWILEYRV